MMTMTALPTACAGIAALDVTPGGLATGCGKFPFALGMLVDGATSCDEPGVFMSFQDKSDDLLADARVLGRDLDALVAEGKLVIDFVKMEAAGLHETGDYSLDGLFVRLGHSVDSIGAKRLVFDTIEALFDRLKNSSVVRSELRRLFTWAEDRGLTIVITGRRGASELLTRQGLAEYASRFRARGGPARSGTAHAPLAEHRQGALLPA